MRYCLSPTVLEIPRNIIEHKCNGSVYLDVWNAFGLKVLMMATSLDKINDKADRACKARAPTARVKVPA